MSTAVPLISQPLTEPLAPGYYTDAPRTHAAQTAALITEPPASAPATPPGLGAAMRRFATEGVFDDPYDSPTEGPDISPGGRSSTRIPTGIRRVARSAMVDDRGCTTRPLLDRTVPYHPTELQNRQLDSAVSVVTIREASSRPTGRRVAFASEDASTREVSPEAQPHGPQNAVDTPEQTSGMLASMEGDFDVAGAFSGSAVAVNITRRTASLQRLAPSAPRSGNSISIAQDGQILEEDHQARATDASNGTQQQDIWQDARSAFASRHALYRGLPGLIPVYRRSNRQQRSAIRAEGRIQGLSQTTRFQDEPAMSQIMSEYIQSPLVRAQYVHQQRPNPLRERHERPGRIQANSGYGAGNRQNESTNDAAAANDGARHTPRATPRLPAPRVPVLLQTEGPSYDEMSRALSGLPRPEDHPAPAEAPHTTRRVEITRSTTIVTTAPMDRPRNDDDGDESDSTIRGSVPRVGLIEPNPYEDSWGPYEEESEDE